MLFISKFYEIRLRKKRLLTGTFDFWIELGRKGQIIRVVELTIVELTVTVNRNASFALCPLWQEMGMFDCKAVLRLRVKWSIFRRNHPIHSGWSTVCLKRNTVVKWEAKVAISYLFEISASVVLFHMYQETMRLWRWWGFSKRLSDVCM